MKSRQLSSINGIRLPVSEARRPLRPEDSRVLAGLSAPTRQSLDNAMQFLLSKDPNATLQQGAEQLLQTPQGKGNLELTNLAKADPRISQMFAANPIRKVGDKASPVQQRITPPPQQLTQQMKGLDMFGQPEELEKKDPGLASMKQDVDQDLQHGAQNPVNSPAVQNQTTQQNKQQAMSPKKQAPSLARQQDPEIGTRNTVRAPGSKIKKPGQPPQQQMEGYNMNEVFGAGDTSMIGFGANMGASLQKILKAVSTLQPQELQMLLKMMNSMMSNPNQGQTGQSSMSRTTITNSQKQLGPKLNESTKKKMFQEQLARSIRSQAKCFQLMESLLSEGPMSNVWKGLKAAGSSGLPQSLTPKEPVSSEDQGKQYSKELMTIIKKATHARQQFKAQVMKNAEIINDYHSAVADAETGFRKVAHTLGSHSGHLKSLIDELVSNLKFDLHLEKEQIAKFLQTMDKLKSTEPMMGKIASEPSPVAPHVVKPPKKVGKMKESVIDRLVDKALSGHGGAIAQLNKLGR